MIRREHKRQEQESNPIRSGVQKYEQLLHVTAIMNSSGQILWIQMKYSKTTRKSVDEGEEESVNEGGEES